VAEDPGRSLPGLVGIPSYDASFRAFTNRVVLERPLSGDAAADARAIYGAIRKGSVFSAIDALAGPAFLDFYVEAGQDRIEMGGVLAADSDATIVARASLPRDAQLVLLNGGREVAGGGRGEIRRAVTGAHGAYRIEVRVPGAPGQPAIPWLVSNPIYFGSPGAKGARGAEGAKGAGAKGAGGAAIPPFPWRIETDPSSSGILRTSGAEVSLEYKLGAGERNNQFVAVASDLQKQPFSAIDLSLAGDRPLRVSVQVRRADGQRWGRSFYVDPAGSVLNIPLSTLKPIGGGASSAISAADVTSILLVLDLANAAPGRSGVLRVRSSALIN
jgi:hypothetical protein